jgi:hypothetical protein
MLNVDLIIHDIEVKLNKLYRLKQIAEEVDSKIFVMIIDLKIKELKHDRENIKTRSYRPLV